MVDTSFPAGLHADSCRVHRWRGYLSATFYAATDAGEVLAESPSFRWRRAAAPAKTPAALRAYGELVSTLLAAGWKPVPEESGDWYATRFVRPPEQPEQLLARIRRATGQHQHEAQPLVPASRAPADTAAAAEALDEPAAVFPPWYEPAAESEPWPAPEPEVVSEPEPEPEPAVRRARRRRWPAAAGALAVIAVAAAAMPASQWLDNHSPAAAAAASHHAAARPAAPAKAAPARPATPAAAPQPRRATPAAALVDLRISARGTGSWIEIRRGSATGTRLYNGVLAGGARLHFRAGRLWAHFGAAGNLSIRADGKPVAMIGTFSKLFVAAG